ncbi:ATP-grasp domain-containing protein [Thermosulfurimonas marina]|uniref:ATP-grasp domain-containing protein n=1 Tax=Thermosulfurimonas marina TaxID=2047767 RepID=A0A6H1WUA6_9BACT|nr:ATP-grasp domain-containing protein [Thermosulfurimonas marina]QJA06734.1 ATP-grasp domain-containing protein [Thermosulfurimonas marina]
MVKVAVSGINAVDNPGPGLGIIKGLKEGPRPVSVVGLAYDAMEPGIYLPHLVDRAYLMPYPSEGEAPFLNRLLYIKEKEGLEVVIPSLDAELPLFIDLQAKLSAYGLASFLPTREQFRLRAKDRLPVVAENIGLKSPVSFAVSSQEELLRALTQLRFPVMIKGLFYKALRAYTEAEAFHHFQTIAAEWGYPVIVQEVVEGEEVNVVGLGDGEGGHFGLLAIKKLWITALGKIWTGVTITLPRLLEAAETFVQKYRWRGAFELEVISHEDELYLIEINPRFPAWIYFAVGVGVNLPERLLAAALGEEPERDWNYPAGKLYIRFTDDLVTDLEVFQYMVTRGER